MYIFSKDYQEKSLIDCKGIYLVEILIQVHRLYIDNIKDL